MGEETQNKSRLFLYLIAGALSILLLTVLAGYLFINHTLSKPSINREMAYYYLPKGSGLLRAAYIAERDGIVEHEWQFRYAALYLGIASRLRSGEFEIPSGMPLEDVLNQIVSGKTHRRKVSIPEGYSNAQILDLLQNSFGVNNDQKILNMPVEGSLLPETYHYERGDTLNSLLIRMEAEMEKAISALWEKRAENLPFKSKEEAIILASIVEKETGLAAERSLVASVFINRLRKNMRLQSDPTIIYGLTEGKPLGRAITKSDLRSDTRYNTYRIDGLPPTAIANPGIDAIKAVLNPRDDVNYLYFVADGSGGHAFAETLSEHNRNVSNWRAIERSMRQ